MKKTLSTLGIGAGLLVGLSSCQSSNFGDYPGGYEEAMPMSELSVGDGELPPWVLEGDDSEQIAAGDYTDDIYAVPSMEDIGEGPAAQASTSPASQNQPAIANAPQDDVVVDRGPAAHDVFSPTDNGASVVSATAAAAKAAAPAPKPVAAAKKTTPAKKKTAKIDKKKVKKVDKPTLVTYKVKPGDNLSLIARRSNTTVEQIRKDSNIKGDTIYAGQIIKVRYLPKGYKPGDKVSAPSTHTVKRGETLSGIAAKYGVTTSALMQANNLNKKTASRIHAGKKLTIPGRIVKADKKGNAKAAAAPRKHTVKRGETISGIAVKYGLTTGQLLKANRMSNADAARLQAGRTLTIPAKKR